MVRWLADRQHLGDERPEQLVAAWESEAASRVIERLSAQFWDDGEPWIAEVAHDGRG